MFPLCTGDLHNFTKPVFSMITHESSVSKFYGNPSNGALDAATLLVS
jgi:hypothetical protein